MKLAMIGLGRMGSNMATRLMRGGHELVGFDQNADAVGKLADAGAAKAGSLEEAAGQMEAGQRIFWVMLPAGEITETTIAAICKLCSEGDIVIDGGNTFYKDDVRRSRSDEMKGLHYVDVGTSGGVWGLERGFCMMIGGDKPIVDKLDPIFSCLAPGLGNIDRTKGRENNPKIDERAERGYIHAGPPGAGHFVKMVHNGIEYGIMAAYAEGFDILQGKDNPKLAEGERYDLNLTDVAEVWRRGSVISSWLLDLSASALAGDPELSKFHGKVADSGEGQWTIDAAFEEAVPAYVLASALFARYRSRVETTFGDKMLSAMRYGFGGHVEMPQ